MCNLEVTHYIDYSNVFDYLLRPLFLPFFAFPPKNVPTFTNNIPKPNEKLSIFVPASP